MNDTATNLRKTARAVARETGWQRPNGYGLGPVGQHRDSGVLDQSNFDTVLADLQSVDDRVDVVRFGHWAVGWVEEILCPLTPAVCTAVASWVDALDDYPIADEDDYSRREYEDALDTLEHGYNVPSESVCDVFSWLFDAYSASSSDDMRQAYVDEALSALGLSDEDDRP